MRTYNAFGVKRNGRTGRVIGVRIIAAQDFPAGGAIMCTHDGFDPLKYKVGGRLYPRKCCKV